MQDLLNRCSQLKTWLKFNVDLYPGPELLGSKSKQLKVVGGKENNQMISSHWLPRGQKKLQLEYEDLWD